MQAVDLFLGLKLTKLLHELVVGAKIVWLYVVEQGEEFIRVVLNRSSGQKHDLATGMLF